MDVRGGGVDGADWWVKRTNPVLDLVSDLYSELEISIGDSGPSSYSAYTIYWLLIYCLTDYCPNKCLTNIPKEGMPTLNGTCRKPHYSSACMSYKGAPQHEASTRKLTNWFIKGDMSYCTSEQ